MKDLCMSNTVFCWVSFCKILTPTQPQIKLSKVIIRYYHITDAAGIGGGDGGAPATMNNDKVRKQSCTYVHGINIANVKDINIVLEEFLSLQRLYL